MAALIAEQLPAPGNRLVQRLEIDLHRFAGEIAFEMQHALLLIEPGGSSGLNRRILKNGDAI